eukprot:jgi/Tetstr1/425457/TSEL_015904.t1
MVRTPDGAPPCFRRMPVTTRRKPAGLAAPALSAPTVPAMPEAMDVDQAAARQAVNMSILVELAKGKTRAPNIDMPVSCRILKRRHLVRFMADMRETIAGM